MPTATPFTALGRGNGFPFCPDKINVSDRGDGQPYDYWTTLDGFNKGSTGVRSDSDLRDSLIAAMKFYWNLKGMNASASRDDDFNNISSSVENVELDDSDEPYTRVCPFYPFAVKIDTSCFNSIGINNEFNFNEFRALKIYRLYNGATNDESNFVGYAAGAAGSSSFSRGLVARSSGDALIRRARATVDLGYAINDDQNLLSYEYEDIGYVTLNDLHFVCRARTELRTDNNSSNAQHTENASALTASASQTISYSANYYNFSASASISELVFWTY
jgi:hypothetical protein